MTSSSQPVTSLTAHFNNIALHTTAMSLSLADNVLLQFTAARTGSTKAGTGSRIETINHPLPRTLSSQTSDAGTTAALTGNRRESIGSFGIYFVNEPNDVIIDVMLRELKRIFKYVVNYVVHLARTRSYNEHSHFKCRAKH